MYKTQGRPAAAAADPYEAIRESIGKGRRQELFSFAVAQLLVMGTPERAALLLRWALGSLHFSCCWRRRRHRCCCRCGAAGGTVAAAAAAAIAV